MASPECGVRQMFLIPTGEETEKTLSLEVEIALHCALQVAQGLSLPLPDWKSLTKSAR